jgi:hypothetical protein
MVETALAQRAAPDRGVRLAQAFEALYLDSLAAHGVADRNATRGLIAVDIELAVQGMEIWLDREENKA